MARLKERVTMLSLRIRKWVAGLSVAALVVLALVALSAASAAGVFMYRTYTYVEHDNQFCLSCHLMVDPYERFAQSAHRGLGCKACHQPTFVERSRMALSQVLENPDEITTHAHVPNSACASCHIDGRPGAVADHQPLDRPPRPPRVRRPGAARADVRGVPLRVDPRVRDLEPHLRAVRLPRGRPRSCSGGCSR
jgi:hypothetical protein